MTANDPDFLATSDLLLVTLKAWQVSQAVRNLAAILPASAPILLIHNGMGTLDELKALNTHCCWRPPLMPPAAMATSSFTSRREQLILDQPKAIAKITAVSPTFCKTSCRMSRHDNIHPALWSKLAVNCVINPLTALKDCRNGDLRDFPQEIGAICHEVAAVMQREGIHTSAENLLLYVNQVMKVQQTISHLCCRIFARSGIRKSTTSPVFCLIAPGPWSVSARKCPFI